VCPFYEKFGFVSNRDLQWHIRKEEHFPFHCPTARCDCREGRGFPSENDLETHVRVKSHGSIHCTLDHFKC
jgi:hypothetical protein